MLSIFAPEEEIKNYVGDEFFADYDSNKILGNIDFCVCHKETTTANPKLTNLDIPINSYLWAEAKSGNKKDIYASFVQLILTIGKQKAFSKYNPPLFLGAFDAEKMAFLRWDAIQGIFTMNDMDWTITPSDHNNKHFIFLYNKIKETLENESLIFTYSEQKELKKFIKDNFKFKNLATQKRIIDKNSFTFIYFRWLEEVKPTISINWTKAKQKNILDADFYLADLISDKDKSLLESLRVVLESDKYRLRVSSSDLGDLFTEYTFNDNAKAYRKFWNKYERPPKEEYWEYIISRRDLLVPQDFRERKGAFYTPQKWVELSQKYIADTLGENWQQEYYIWDCAAGTGNLLNGLTESHRIFASTLDEADVAVMKTNIKEYRSNLLESHVFQFDFLNDELPNVNGKNIKADTLKTKLPKDLVEILLDDEKRKKLIIYINPPYAEVSSTIGKGKAGVNLSKIHTKYTETIGPAGREIFTQFLLRINEEIPCCILAEFSKLKILQGAAFAKMRDIFQPQLKSMFICPANSFDNVAGAFPIGFKIWNTSIQEKFKQITADVYDTNKLFLQKKTISLENNYISRWITSFECSSMKIGFLAGTNGNDFQHNNIVYILNRKEQMGNPRGVWVTNLNLIQCFIYFAIRKCIPANWLNDRDQFLYPNDGWKSDIEFQNNCLTYTLFNEANNIKSKEGVNHWIPFLEKQVNAQQSYSSHFMIDFIGGNIQPEKKDIQGDLFNSDNTNKVTNSNKLIFSKEALAVFYAGKELWRYYHKTAWANKNIIEYNVNASYYDIREYFQGRNDKGKMNNKSDDETYNKLLENLKAKQKTLAEKIAEKVYEYEFLK